MNRDTLIQILIANLSPDSIITSLSFSAALPEGEDVGLEGYGDFGIPGVWHIGWQGRTP